MSSISGGSSGSGGPEIQRLIAEIQLADGADRLAIAKNISLRLKELNRKIREAYDELKAARAQAAAAAAQAAAASAAAESASAQAADAEAAAQAALEQALLTMEQAQAAAEEAQAIATSLKDAAAAGQAAAQAAIAAAEQAMAEAQQIWADARELALQLSQLPIQLNREIQEKILELKSQEQLPLSNAEPVARPGAAIASGQLNAEEGTLAASCTDPLVFDAEEYLARYPDLGAAGITTEEQAITHWLTYGISEGRVGNDSFDPVVYLNVNPAVRAELEASGATDLNHAALEHFVTQGSAAGLVSTLDPAVAAHPSIFNAEIYLAIYPDLRAAGIDTPAEAQEHWLRYGLFEGRTASEGFSTQAYLMRYPEAAAHAEATGTNPYLAALNHYEAVGKPNGYSGRIDVKALTDASVFDAAYYLENNPDLWAAGITTPEAATLHWLAHGVYESRQGCADFDVTARLGAYAAVEGVRPRDAVVNELDALIARGRESQHITRDITFDAATGLQLDVHHPPGDGPHPVMIMLHGGGWQFGDKADVAMFGNNLSQSGIAVVAANYSMTADAAGNPTGVTFPTPMEEITRMLEWVVAHAEEYNFDLNDVQIGGVSAGAHLALQYALNGAAYGHTADLPQFTQVLAIAPATDLHAGVLAEDTYGNEWLQPMIDAIGGGDQALLDDSSPINHIGNGAASSTHFIVMAGDDDPITAFNTQYAPFVQRMTEAGYDITGIVSEGGSHGDWLVDPNDEDFLENDYWSQLLGELEAPAIQPKRLSVAEEIGLRVDAMQTTLGEAQELYAQVRLDAFAVQQGVAGARRGAREVAHSVDRDLTTVNELSPRVRELLDQIATLKDERDTLLTMLLAMQGADFAQQVQEAFASGQVDGEKVPRLNNQQLAELLRRLEQGGSLTVADVAALFAAIDGKLEGLVTGAREVCELLGEAQGQLGGLLQQLSTAGERTQFGPVVPVVGPTPATVDHDVGLASSLLARYGQPNAEALRTYQMSNSSAFWERPLSELENAARWPDIANGTLTHPAVPGTTPFDAVMAELQNQLDARPVVVVPRPVLRPAQGRRDQLRPGR